jgi:hypothetical protein
VVRRKLFERRFDSSPNFTSPNDPGRIGPVEAGDEEAVTGLIEGCVVQRFRLATRRLAHEVDRKIRDDSIEPREETRAPLERLEPPIDSQEGFLNDLASVIFVPDQANRDGEGAALMPFDETSKGVGTAGASLRDEDTIFFGLELSGLFIRRFSAPGIHGGPDTEIMGFSGPCGGSDGPDARQSWLSASEFAS